MWGYSFGHNEAICYTITTFISSCRQEELYREELCWEEVVLGKADALNSFKLSYVCRQLEHISFKKLLKKCLRLFLLFIEWKMYLLI